MLTPDSLDERARDTFAAAGHAGIDHVGSLDHVSFRTGEGVDSLITAASIAGLHPTLGLYTTVYLLALRHPVTVARQLSTLAQFAPGRLTFGVGLGGEDRHEFEICGVDPSTRGRRMDESLEVLRGLLAGETFSFHGEFFDLDEARILPAPPVPIPIVVGGRSDAALRRTARYGDGWVAVWNSVRRFSQALEMIDAEAEAAGRASTEWLHTQSGWCGIGATREEAAARLAPEMKRYYGLDFDAFEKYSPCGRPEDIAEFLSPYVQAGARMISLVPIAPDLDEAVDAIAEVKRLLVA
jgi:alkanesulfonate monooxygenase SsuD/methylene tetrahydromethanopterin reductase-like flavin-dependent oxidoreductase (luciferase family)